MRNCLVLKNAIALFIFFAKISLIALVVVVYTLPMADAKWPHKPGPNPVPSLGQIIDKYCHACDVHGTAIGAATNILGSFGGVNCKALYSAANANRVKCSRGLEGICDAADVVEDFL